MPVPHYERPVRTADSLSHGHAHAEDVLLRILDSTAVPAAPP